MNNFVYPNQPPVVIRYGKFLQALIYLLIIGLLLFFVIRAFQKFNETIKKKLQEESDIKKRAEDERFNLEIQLLTEIRNILAWKSSIFEEIAL